MSQEYGGVSPLWLKQQRLGFAFLVAFVAALLSIWAAAPIKALIDEHVLGNIAYQNEDGFAAGFGALPELVKDQGGSQPVPIIPDEPLRSPEYRDANWVMTQDSSALTLQVAVLSSERAVANFLGAHADREQFNYFMLPAVVSAQTAASHLSSLFADAPKVPAPARYIITYGNFVAHNQAEEVASALRGLPSSPLIRLWSTYQDSLKAAPAVIPVQAPSAHATDTPVQVLPQSPQATLPTPMPTPGLTNVPRAESSGVGPATGLVGEPHASARSKETQKPNAQDPLQTAPVTTL